jgi:iron complex outermembrane receptor protein
MMRAHTLRNLAATMGLCGTLAMLTVANAQTEPASSDTAQLQELVVTGSRLERASGDQPAPVATLSHEDLEKTGFSNLGDILMQMPQVGIGLGTTSSAFGDDGGNYGPNAGSTFVSLRGLGENRTLVLVDGLRRVSGSSLSSAVDLGTIPANMIQSVDVTTGGAAAVYGADAVTGVVNVKLRHDFNGLELSAQSGISKYGDDPRTQLGLLYGHSGDGDSFTVGLSYTHEPSIDASARPFGTLGLSYAPNPNITPSNPYQYIQVRGGRLPLTSYGGTFTIGNTLYTVGANNQVRPVQDGATLGGAAYDGGDGFNEDDFNTLRIETSVLSALGTYTKEITPNLRFIQDIQYSNSKSDAPLQPLFEFGTTVNRNNPYLPASVAALMDANQLGSISVDRTDWDQGLNHRKNDRNTATSVSKFEGDIGSDLKWNVFYQYGIFDNQSIFTNDRVDSLYAQAVDAVAGPNGPVCADPTAVAAGCKPINILGPNAANPQALQYFHYNTNTEIQNTQQVAGAQLSGKLFRLPDGPVQFSSGLEFRRETENVTGDPLANMGLLHADYDPPTSAASFDVKEAFVETLVPVLRDEPFAKVLEVEAADRVSDYNTVGRTNAWKLGAQWAPVEDFRIRVMDATSVRAPNLTELDSPGAVGLTGYYDPCSAPFINTGSSTRPANCAALGVPANYQDPRLLEARFQNVVGNPNLKPEIAKTWTVGAQITPRFLPGFDLSVDWWSIDIKQAIDSLPVQNIINGCVDASSINNPFCSLVIRGNSSYAGITDPHAISVVNVAPLNIGELQAEGIDLKSNYRSPNQAWLQAWTGAPSRFKVSYDATWYMKNLSILNTNDPSNAVHTAGTSVLPKFRFTLKPAVDVGAFSLAWSVRFIGASEISVDTPLVYNDNKVASRTYNDLYATYSFDKPQVQLAFGVNNVFNVAPPLTGATYEGTGAGALFDNIGTYFYLRVTVKL